MELVTSFYLGVSDYLNCEEGGQKECDHFSDSDKDYQNFDRCLKHINIFASRSSFYSEHRNKHLEHFDLESSNVDKLRAELEFDDEKITSKNFCIEYVTQEEDPCLPVLAYLDSVFLIPSNLIEDIEEHLEDETLLSNLIINEDIIESSSIEVAYEDEDQDQDEDEDEDEE